MNTIVAYQPSGGWLCLCQKVGKDNFTFPHYELQKSSLITLGFSKAQIIAKWNIKLKAQ